MLGIDDPWVWSAYILSFVATGVCVVYGLAMWNKGDDSAPTEEDKRWAQDEDVLEKEL